MPVHKILFIVDGRLDRPLLHSQGLPLLAEIRKEGSAIWIISFEDLVAALKNPLAQKLSESNIHWFPIIVSPDVSGIQRIQMIVKGFIKAFLLCRHENIDIVHCRSYRPGFIGSLLKICLGTGFLFDMRGFLPDELVADGRWQAGSLKYRFAKFIERWMILQSDIITTTSPEFSKAVLDLPLFYKTQCPIPVISIPNCVDVNRFKPDPDKRIQSRLRLGWDGAFHRHIYRRCISIP